MIYHTTGFVSVYLSFLMSLCSQIHRVSATADLLFLTFLMFGN